MKCPTYQCVMVCGVPHGPWTVQYECRHCGTIIKVQGMKDRLPVEQPNTPPAS